MENFHSGGPKSNKLNGENESEIKSGIIEHEEDKMGSNQSEKTGEDIATNMEDEKRFKYIIGHPGSGVNIGVTKNGDVYDYISHEASSNQDEALRFLHNETEKKIEEFGLGPVKVKVQYVSKNGGYSPSIESDKNYDYGLQLVYSDTPLSSSEDSGLYKVIEIEFDSLRSLASQIGHIGGGIEITDETMWAERVRQALRYAYRKTNLN